MVVAIICNLIMSVFVIRYLEQRKRRYLVYATIVALIPFAEVWRNYVG
jgi:hypothetical protein